ncbi:MAG: hypothetical protein R6W78_12455, partial [Bacteroidales bacterium]
MKNRYLLTLFILVITGLSAGISSLTGQSFSHPSVGLVINGNLLDAGSGNDFISIVYERDGGIYFNRLVADGTWENEQLLGSGTEACIATDLNGDSHIAFVSKDTIVYLNYNGNVWSERDSVKSLSIGGTGKCSKPDIAVDINGVVHLTYTDSHGSSGDNYTHPDIMYAYKSAADFVIQLIYRGYRDYSSSGSWGADYFSKGSNIAVNNNGDYFIIAHRHNIWRWSFGTDNTYYIMINSNLGNGSVSNYGTDIFATYDMAFNGNTVLALYKQTTYKVSELTISGTDIGFSNTFDVL